MATRFPARRIAMPPAADPAAPEPAAAVVAASPAPLGDGRMAVKRKRLMTMSGSSMPREAAPPVDPRIAVARAAAPAATIAATAPPAVDRAAMMARRQTMPRVKPAPAAPVGLGYGRRM